MLNMDISDGFLNEFNLRLIQLIQFNRIIYFDNMACSRVNIFSKINFSVDVPGLSNPLLVNTHI